MTFALVLLLIFTSCLDAILAARSDIQALPFSGINSRQKNPQKGALLRKLGKAGQVILWLRETWDGVIGRITELLEMWSAPKDDKQVAWTLGIGWACCGGGLAGGCLVFAKAMCVLFTFCSILFDPLTVIQSETTLWVTLSSEPRQSIWTCCSDFHDHPTLSNRSPADYLLEPGS